jgi:hypothetical protein
MLSNQQKQTQHYARHHVLVCNCFDKPQLCAEANDTLGIFTISHAPPRPRSPGALYVVFE